MPLKSVEIDGKTYAEVQDGKPVYIDAEGKTHVYDAEAMRSSLNRLQADLDNTKSENSRLSNAMKAFDGLSDPAAARKALETVANLDAKKLIDAGEVERVKGEISKAFEEKLTAAERRAQDLEGALYSEKIGGAFARSKFIADKIAVPADMIQATFGSAFKVEDGRAVAFDANGQKIYSRANPGELAQFDEALEILVSAYPNKEHILKGTGHQGTGKEPGKHGAGNSSKTISRADFDKLSQTDRSAKMRDGFKITD